MIRIVLADDQRVVRETLRLRLVPEADIEIVGEARDGQQAINQVGALQPDVLLIDLEMPVIHGLKATQLIRQRYPDTNVLVLTGHDDEESLNQAMQSGIKGYLLKTTPTQELADAVRAVHRGYFHLGPGLIEKYVSTPQISAPHASPDRDINQGDDNGTTALSSNSQTIATAPTHELSRNDISKNGLTKNGITQTDSALSEFDRPVVLQQSPVWSRLIIWGISGVTVAAVAWACLFKIEEAIPATGQLKPQGAVKDVQVPVSGVVREIFIEDGQQVRKGEVLLQLNPKATRSELDYLSKTGVALKQENAFYRSQLQGDTPQQQPTNIPPDMLSLAQSRQALVAEIRLFRVLLNGKGESDLNPEERLRLRSSQQDVASRTEAAKLRVGQLEQQLRETKIQLASAQRTLEVNQGILDDITPLAKSGGLSKVQYLRQLQEVETGEAEAKRLAEEEIRLELAIAEGKEEVTTIVSSSSSDLLRDIATNDKQIAEIDSQFTKQMVENQKQIADITNRLNQAKLTLQYQEVKSPVDGKVFDLKAHTPGFVANASEPILKIVPSDSLVAEVYITNKDIGFIKEGMAVDVRVDSFPFSEFGDIKGTLESIGSDALEPTQTEPFYRFPATVELQKQALTINDRALPLQSGMSISVNIKVRKRTVMSIFTDQFTRQVDQLKGLR